MRDQLYLVFPFSKDSLPTLLSLYGWNHRHKILKLLMLWLIDILLIIFLYVAQRAQPFLLAKQVG